MKSLFKLLVICIIFISYSSCKDDPIDPTKESSLLAVENVLSSYQIAEISCKNMKLSETVYSGDLGGITIELNALNDTTLVFMTPKMSSGNFKLTTNINDKLFSIDYKVTLTDTIDEPVKYVSNMIEEINLIIDTISFRIDSLAKYGIVQSGVEKQILQTIQDSLNQYNQEFLLLSGEDQSKTAQVLSANMTELNFEAELLNTLTSELNVQSIYTRGSSCNQLERSGRMRCLMNQFNSLGGTVDLSVKLNTLIKVLTVPMPGWTKLPLKILSYNVAKIEEQYFLAGFELASKPYHPVSIINNNPVASFSNFKSAIVSLNIVVRNVKENPDASDKYWEKDFAKNFNKLIKGWNSSLFNLFSSNKRSFPILIQPKLLPENADILSVNKTNSDVMDFSFEDGNFYLRFGTKKSAEQNFTYNIEYNDQNFSIKTPDVQAVVTGKEPHILVYISGNNQKGELGQQLINPLKVIVNDTEGNPFNGALVKFICNNGGLVSYNQVTTGIDGTASVTWKLGSSDNTQTVTVKAFKNDNITEIQGSPFTFTAIAASCSSTVMIGGYEAVTIGTQIWMVKNLNIKTADSWCYNNDTVNCDIYGRLYTWNAAVNVCPAGWHLPTIEEWCKLDFNSGGNLKSTTGWDSPNTGATNSTCFTALPGGSRYDVDGKFYQIGKTANWWSSEDLDSEYSSYSYLNHDRNEFNCAGGAPNSSGLSVRCLKD